MARPTSTLIRRELAAEKKPRQNLQCLINCIYKSTLHQHHVLVRSIWFICSWYFMISCSASVRTDVTDRKAEATPIKVRFVNCANATTCLQTFFQYATPIFRRSFLFAQSLSDNFYSTLNSFLYWNEVRPGQRRNDGRGSADHEREDVSLERSTGPNRPVHGTYADALQPEDE